MTLALLNTTRMRIYFQAYLGKKVSNKCVNYVDFPSTCQLVSFCAIRKGDQRIEKANLKPCGQVTADDQKACKQMHSIGI